MFKNPLKYQNGGSVQAREQVVSAISEIAQIPVEEVNSKLDQISQDQESIQLLSEALQAVQKGDERGYQVIKQMFNPQSETGVFAKGGKIQDFICKHAKGGNVKECGCGGKTEKYQNPAGPIGRRQALDVAKANYGFNDSQSRMAYANAKNALRSQGLRGRELRQRARQMLMGQLPQETRRPLLATVDAPQLPQAYSVEDTSNLAGGTSEQQQRNNYRQVQDYSGSDFNAAFGNARSAYMNNNGPGLFRWNGNLYNTNLGSDYNTTGSSNSNSNRNERFSVWNNEYTRSGLGREEAMERAADKYGVVLFDKDGGEIEKAQDGTRSLYQQIAADGPETYVDGYGTVREMNESPIISGLRKAYHWINMDRTLSDNAYSQKHGYSKPLTGMPPAVYISPVAQEIELAKIIGNRIPKQKPTIRISENLGNGKFSAIDDFGKPVIYDAERDKGLFQIIDENTFKPEPGLDWDIDKRYGQSLSMIKPIHYDFSKLGRITISWPEFIGKTALKWTPGIVGSAALGSYIATKKDKKKNSGGGSR